MAVPVEQVTVTCRGPQMPSVNMFATPFMKLCSVTTVAIPAGQSAVTSMGFAGTSPHRKVSTHGFTITVPEGVRPVLTTWRKHPVTASAATATSAMRTGFMTRRNAAARVETVMRKGA